MSLHPSPQPPPASPAAATVPAAAGGETAGARRALGARLRRAFVQRMLVVGGICVGIAAFLAVLDGRNFFGKLLYSASIGACCWLCVELTRYLIATLTDALRRVRGVVIVDSPSALGWRGVVPGSLLAVLVGPAAGIWIADLISGQRSSSLLNFDASSRVTLMISLGATAVTLVIIGTLERLATARAQAEAAQRQAAENQLRLLQSQLEPHMLFNTLANLRVLIGLDAQRAQQMLDRLIGFLRATLSASRQASHPLAAEFSHLDDYLALMAVRMGPRLQVQLQLPEALASLPVPPLLLQPLVENAIKHGLEPKLEGGRIEITAARDGDRLCLQVRDTGVGLEGTGTGGTAFGLEQVRARLATLYGPRASLRLDPAVDAEGGALATLMLPLP